MKVVFFCVFIIIKFKGIGLRVGSLNSNELGLGKKC